MKSLAGKLAWAAGIFSIIIPLIGIAAPSTLLPLPSSGVKRLRPTVHPEGGSVSRLFVAWAVRDKKRYRRFCSEINYLRFRVAGERNEQFGQPDGEQ
jgi:hypothetical protein